ncbi:MAG: hypothetical protein GXP55_15230 [Deltaproteobacteria bacterium]|nr:hypothetical protein [Deltaproteobacteria bacterium]
MTSGARKFLDDAYGLDEADRAIVSGELSEGVEDAEEVGKAWLSVAVKRLERHERGEGGETQSLDELEADLRDSIKEA